LEKDVEMTRIEKGNQAGGQWDRVRLKNGIIGYIASQYLVEVPKAQIERMELKMEQTVLKKGEQAKLMVTIYPFEACNQPVEYSSTNPSVATIDNKGMVQALRSGKTTLIVKAANGNATSQIEITVRTPVEKIEIQPKELYLPVGTNQKITISAFPEDADIADVVLTSSAPEIASISDGGILQAKQEGNAKIIARLQENPSIQAEADVWVVRPMQENEISFEPPLIEKNLILTGLAVKANTVADMKAKINTTKELEFVNHQDKILQETDLVGTGCKIRVKEQGAILRQYTVVVYGDADGNGKINGVDLLVIQRHILEIEKMNPVFCQASNLQKNGKNPSALDLLLIQRHILEIEEINQS